MKVLISVALATILTTSVSAFDMSSMTSMATSAASSMSSSDNKSGSLVDMLTSSLGVTPTQATGGATALLSDAASKMSKEDVNALTSKVPAVSNMVNQNSSAMGGLGSMASSALGNDSVKSAFSALGMDADMVAQFTPIILNYVDSEAGASMMKSVKAALLD